MKVLIVDDNRLILEACRRALEPEGYEVVTATDAERALTMVRGEAVGLVLADVRMPGRNGIWLIREIARMRPGLPVVAISGFPAPEGGAGLPLRGLAGFLAKPFTPTELVATVRGVAKEVPNATAASPGDR
jgi:DNA-binding NtrC family response regulator